MLIAYAAPHRRLMQQKRRRAKIKLNHDNEKRGKKSKKTSGGKLRKRRHGLDQRMVSDGFAAWVKELERT